VNPTEAFRLSRHVVRSVRECDRLDEADLAAYYVAGMISTVAVAVGLDPVDGSIQIREILDDVADDGVEDESTVADRVARRLLVLMGRRLLG
jgi:hypothetical protein